MIMPQRMVRASMTAGLVMVQGPVYVLSAVPAGTPVVASVGKPETAGGPEGFVGLDGSLGAGGTGAGAVVVAVADGSVTVGRGAGRCRWRCLGWMACEEELAVAPAPWTGCNRLVWFMDRAARGSPFAALTATPATRRTATNDPTATMRPRTPRRTGPLGRGRRCARRREVVVTAPAAARRGDLDLPVEEAAPSAGSGPRALSS
jgi:hypothetical protein